MGPLSAARRYFANRRESRHARRMEAELQAEEAREQKAAEVERRQRDVLSGAVGCYAVAQAVERSEGRVLSEMLRNVAQLDLDAMGVTPGETIVASQLEGGLGSLAPPGERDRYTDEPQLYFVDRGSVDILAPGPNPEDEKNNKFNNRKKKKWHVVFSVMPGGCFSGPLGELLGGCPTDHKVVCAAPDTSLLSCPFSVLRRSGGLQLMDEARAAGTFIPACNPLFFFFF